MKRVHYFSGLAITLFIGVHLFNHLLSLFGPELHLAFMDTIRAVYRHPIIETILLSAVVVQIITGLKLFFLKKSQAAGWYEKLQLWTGFYLAFFLLVHVGAVLAGRYLLQLDTNFYFGVAGLNTFPFYLFFVPYYGLAILTFFGHFAAIHHYKMKSAIFGLSVELQTKLILITGGIMTLITLYGLTNGFSGFEIPEAYHILIGK